MLSEVLNCMITNCTIWCQWLFGRSSVVLECFDGFKAKSEQEKYKAELTKAQTEITPIQ